MVAQAETFLTLAAKAVVLAVAVAIHQIRREAELRDKAIPADRETLAAGILVEAVVAHRRLAQALMGVTPVATVDKV